MGIGWLWIYTHSDNPDVLTRENETRAFAIYSRWRSIAHWTVNIYTQIRAFHRTRASQRTLLALSDHILQDIGMFRTGTDVRFEATGRINRSKNGTTTFANYINKDTDKDSQNNSVIMKVTYFQKKPKATANEPKLKVQC